MNAMDTAIYGKLQSSSSLTSLLSGTTAIYSVQAPENAALPYVVFSVQGGGDENMDRHRTKNLVYYIRAYSKVGQAQAGSIDAAVDAALHLQTLSPSGWANFWTAREEDVSAVENPPNAQPIHMVGGMYRIRIEKT